MNYAGVSQYLPVSQPTSVDSNGLGAAFPQSRQGMDQHGAAILALEPGP